LDGVEDVFKFTAPEPELEYELFVLSVKILFIFNGLYFCCYCLSYHLRLEDGVVGWWWF